jgi:hypothetical protein
MAGTNYPAPLDGVLYLSTMVILAITLRGQWTMWFVRETLPVSKLVITQRRRYGWTLVGQLAAVAAVLWPLMQYGVDETFNALDAWWQVPPIGWIVVGVFWIGIGSPVLTLLTMISIYRHPAKAAKQVRGGYVLTRHVRQRLARPPVALQPVVAPGSSGLLKRYWFAA